MEDKNPTREMQINSIFEKFLQLNPENQAKFDDIVSELIDNQYK